MSIIDAKGNLHSEETGRFIAKNDAQQTPEHDLLKERARLPYLTVEQISRIIVQSNPPGDMLRHLIQIGAVNLKIKQGAQDKHIIGTKNYLSEIELGRKPSILTADPYQLIMKLAGTGTPVIANGEWKGKEQVTNDTDIGYYVDIETGEQSSTNNATIHYSNNGTHIVPRRR